MTSFLLAYDIFDTKRLPKVKKIAYSFALGGQKSALEAPLDKSLAKQLVKSLKPLIEEEDKVNIICISSKKPILLGKAKYVSYENNGVIII